MENIKIEKVAFEEEKHGYNFKATYLLEPKGQALIEISKDGKVVREFLFPSYKIWNIPAHADDIIDGLEKSSDNGILIAGSNGLGGNVYTPDEPKVLYTYKGIKEVEEKLKKPVTLTQATLIIAEQEMEIMELSDALVTVVNVINGFIKQCEDIDPSQLDQIIGRAKRSTESKAHIIRQKQDKAEGWIPVSERLPEDQTHIQVYAPNCTIIGSVLVGMYFEESNNFTVYDFAESKIDEKVTHWRPLPSHPEL